MQLDYKEQESLRQYLLGSLPPEEIAALEERLLTDDVFYDELLMVEDELIDQYLSGEQSATERQSFEAHFAVAPERKQKVRFALLELGLDCEIVPVDLTKGEHRNREFLGDGKW